MSAKSTCWPRPWAYRVIGCKTKRDERELKRKIEKKIITSQRHAGQSRKEAARVA